MIGTLISAGVAGASAYSAHQERKKELEHRKEVEQYNKELNAKKSVQTSINNNPALQIAKAKQAGINPNTYMEGGAREQKQQDNTETLPPTEVQHNSSQALIDLFGKMIEIFAQEQNNAEVVRHNKADEGINQQNAETNQQNAETNQQNAETNQQNADTQEKAVEQQNKESEERIDKMRYEKEAIALENKFKREYNPQQLREIKQRIENLKSENDYTKSLTSTDGVKREYSQLMVSMEKLAQRAQGFYGLRPEEMTIPERQSLMRALKTLQWDKVAMYSNALGYATPEQMREFFRNQVKQEQTIRNADIYNNSQWRLIYKDVTDLMQSAVDTYTTLRGGAPLAPKPRPVGFGR